MIGLWLTLLLAFPVFGRQAGLVYHECQVVDEFGRNVTDITSVTIYAPGTTSAQTIYMDSALASAITQPMTTSSTNTTLASGKFYWWGPDGWDFTVTDGTNTHVNFGHNAMSASMSRIVFPSYLQAISSTTYTDDQTATWGSGGDFVFQGGNTANRFTVTPAATDESPVWWFGANTTGIDVVFYAGTTGDYVQWDASDESLEFVDTSLALDDGSPLYFGSSTDVTIQYDGSNNDLDITSTTALDEISFGATGAGYDIVWWGTTAGDYVLFDYSADAILLEDIELFLGDGEGLYFGDTVGTGDFKISDETDVLTIDVITPGTGEIAIGNDADDVPMKWYGETTGDFVYFTGDDLQIEDMSLCLADATQLQFGDPLGTGDIKMYANGTELVIDGVVAETGTISIGLTDVGIDFKLWAATAAEGVLWDASDEALEFTGANILLDDAADLILGTGLDWTIDCDTAKTLDIIPVDTDETPIVNIGKDTQGADLKVFGATTGEYWSYDASADTIVVNTGNAIYTMTDAEANQFKVDATGTVAGNAIVLETTAGGIQLLADGATQGDITIDAEDDIAITTAGDLALDMTVGVGTFKGSWLPDSMLKKTITTGTLSSADCGYVLQVSADAQTITLPSTATGLEFTIMNIAADGGALITVTPAAVDKFIGAGLTGAADQESLLNTKVTADKGDYIRIVAHTDGWVVAEMNGTWAEATP